MRREPGKLADRQFDLAIVGGGIFGICVAWDATLRGLSVCLIEKGDFAAGASANCYKVVHGGIRYLQHANLVRLRASCRERSALLRVAPHLVQPLPIVVPTYGYAQSGKAFLGAGMIAYDLLTCDRNAGIADPQRRIPSTRFMSRAQVLESFPGVPPEGLTGGAVFADGQMYNPARLALAFLRSAMDEGAVACNYVRATGFTSSDGRVSGVEARDEVSGDEFTIRARTVCNATGGWSNGILAARGGPGCARPDTFSRDACFVVARRFDGPLGLAIQGRTRDPDALVSRPARHLFVLPWRDYSLIGVWHKVYRDDPDVARVAETELGVFIDEINWALPELRLTVDDVLHWNAGLVPFGETQEDGVNLSYGKESRLIDHARADGVEGLVTLTGVRYTMARGDAARAVDLLARKLDCKVPRPATEKRPVHGGAFGSFETLLSDVRRDFPQLQEQAIRALAHNHGSDYGAIRELARAEPELAVTMGGSTVLKAQIVHACRHEMPLTLSDVVLRRTELASAGSPGDAVLLQAAELVAQELGWDRSRTATELKTTRQRLAVRERDCFPASARADVTA